MELLNVRFSFLCRSTRTNDDGKHPIVLRVIYRSERRDLFTGLYCEKREWNPKLGQLHRLNKTCGAINDNLDLISRKAYEVFQQLRYGGVDFTIDELVSKIKGEDAKPELLMDYLEGEKARIKSGWALTLHRLPMTSIDVAPPMYSIFCKQNSR